MSIEIGSYSAKSKRSRNLESCIFGNLFLPTFKKPWQLICSKKDWKLCSLSHFVFKDLPFVNFVLLPMH